VGLLVVSAVAAALIRFAYGRAARAAAEASVQRAAAAFAAMEKDEVEKLSVGLTALAANPELVRPFRADDREGLLRAALPILHELRDRAHVTHWTFHRPDGTVFLRVHDPARLDDRIDRPTLARAAQRGEVAWGLERGRTAFALRAVLPWRVEGQVIGYLELGEEVRGILAALKEQTGDEVAVYTDAVDVDAGPQRGVVLVDATKRIPWPRGVPPVAELAPRGELVDDVDRGADVRGVFPARDEVGVARAAVVVAHRIEPLQGGLGDVRGRIVLTVILLAGGVAGLVVFLLDVLVFDRLRKMSELLEELPVRIALGDYHVEEPLVPPPDDELGRFERIFHRAVQVLAGALREAGGPRQPG
jgi:hypothetical protein